MKVWRAAMGGTLLVAVAAACTGFDEQAMPTSDGGVDDAGFDASVGVDQGSPVPADGGVDAGPCSKCRSGQCYPDAGCFPQVFVTSDGYRADFGADGAAPTGLERADAICNELARAVPGTRPGTFKAWLSVTNVTAISRITENYPNGAQRPVVDPTGTVLAASYESLVAQGRWLDGGVARSPGGGIVGEGVAVWTGTDEKGKPENDNAANRCDQWMSAAEATNGARIGYVGRKDKTWTNGYDRQCPNPAHLYCFEVVP